MHDEPFIYLHTNGTPRRYLSVLPSFEGFVLHDGERLRLLPGMHRLQCGSIDAVFLVRVGGTHRLELRSLGGAMLRHADGSWRPIKVLGRLVYGVRCPELLIDLLEREQIYEPRELERELQRMLLAQLANVFEGEPLPAEALSANLDVVSCEVLRRLNDALEPCGIALQGLDLLAAPGSEVQVAS